MGTRSAGAIRISSGAVNRRARTHFASLSSPLHHIPPDTMMVSFGIKEREDTLTNTSESTMLSIDYALENPPQAIAMRLG